MAAGSVRFLTKVKTSEYRMGEAKYRVVAEIWFVPRAVPVMITSVQRFSTPPAGIQDVVPLAQGQADRSWR